MFKIPPQTLLIARITLDSIRKGKGIFLLLAHIAFITSISCVRSITHISIVCPWMRLRLLLYPQQYPARAVSNVLFSPLCSDTPESIYLSLHNQASTLPSYILFVLQACAASSNIVRYHTIIVLHGSIHLRCSLLHFPLRCPRFLLAHHR